METRTKTGHNLEVGIQQGTAERINKNGKGTILQCSSNFLRALFFLLGQITTGAETIVFAGQLCAQSRAKWKGKVTFSTRAIIRLVKYLTVLSTNRNE